MRSREEQIADLTNLFGAEGTFSFVDDRDAATKHILEAERRAEQRVRAEIARDSERLDWIGSQDVVIGEFGFGSSTWEDVLLARYQRSLPADLDDIRASIDVARKAQG